MMNLFVDDIRNPPDDGIDWTVVRTAEEAIVILKAREHTTDANKIHRMSLDHDLGPGKTGYDVITYVEKLFHETDYPGFIPPWCTCHSANPVGRQRIEQVIRKLNEDVRVAFGVFS